MSITKIILSYQYLLKNCGDPCSVRLEKKTQLHRNNNSIGSNSLHTDSFWRFHLPSSGKCCLYQFALNTRVNQL